MFRLGRDPDAPASCRAVRALKIIAAAAPMLLSGCVENGVSFMAPDGPIAAMQRDHFWYVTLISLIVVLPVLIGVPWLAWRYRYGNTKARYTPHWEFSHALEYAMWLIPAAIVVALSVLLWQGTHKLDPYKAIASDKAPLKVQVVGLDWKWLFIYPQYHVATVGEMAFPQDRPVEMELTTDTVMQSFMVSSLAGQIYAMPGMVTKMHLAADHPGHFDGDNTQYNGDGFHNQHFTAVAMTKADFDGWMKKVQTDGTALNPMAYDRLAASSTAKQVRATFGTQAMPPHATYFNDVPSGLFKKIVNRYHSGKPVPAEMQPGSAAYNAKYSG